jgi:hypothetical protein
MLTGDVSWPIKSLRVIGFTLDAVTAAVTFFAALSVVTVDRGMIEQPQRCSSASGSDRTLGAG